MKPTTNPEVLLREAAKLAQQRVAEHLERFAAAYIKQTDIPAADAYMHYQFDMATGHMKIWFERKQ